MKLFLIGFMGSGKSSLAKKLGTKLNLPVFDLDKEIEKQAKKSIAEIFMKNGEEYFRSLESDCLKSLINSHENFILACGGGTACFNINMELINAAGISLFLDVNEEILFGRLRMNKKDRPLIADMEDEQLKAFVKNLLEKRRKYYQLAKLIIQEDNPTVNLVLSKLKSFQIN